MVQVFLHDIFYFEGMKDYVHILTKKGDYVVKQQLRCFDDELPDDKFVRIHRSFIVSIPKIRAFTSSSVEINKKVLPIGRSYREKFLQTVGLR